MILLQTNNKGEKVHLQVARLWVHLGRVMRGGGSLTGTYSSVEFIPFMKREKARPAEMHSP